MTQVYIIAQKPPNLHRPSENEQRALTQTVPSSFAVLSAQRHGMSSGEQVELATAEAMQGIFGVISWQRHLTYTEPNGKETGRTAHGGSLAMMMLALESGDGDGEGDGEDAAGPPVLGPAVTEGRSAGAPARMAQNGNRIIKSISQSINQCTALMASKANVASGNMDGSLMHPRGSQIATLAFGTGNF